MTTTASIQPLLTSDVARLLGVAPFRLHSLIKGGRLAPPPRDSGLRFVWQAEHVEAARQALRVDRRRREHRQAQASA